jgi:acetolactate synthase-1/3 small subunit
MVSTKHTLVALVEDKPGVLNRMVSLFRRRGFNISSIAVGSSESTGLARVTFVVDGSLTMVEVRKQLLAKIVEIVKVADITEEDIVVRELALIKVKASAGSSRSEIIQIVDIFRADIVDVSQDTLTIEVTGTENKVNSLMDLIRPFGIKEIARTGRIAMTRGSPLFGEEKQS